MDFGIKGKLALVTAASKGIGRATAAGLLAEGARVMICARNAEELYILIRDGAYLHRQLELGDKYQQSHDDLRQQTRIKFAELCELKKARMEREQVARRKALCILNASIGLFNQFWSGVEIEKDEE